MAHPSGPVGRSEGGTIRPHGSLNRVTVSAMQIVCHERDMSRGKAPDHYLESDNPIQAISCQDIDEKNLSASLRWVCVYLYVNFY
jgi:hypothetical protein